MSHPTRRSVLTGSAATAGAWALGCAGVGTRPLPELADLDRAPIRDPDARDRRPTTGRCDKLPPGFSWVRDQFDGLDRESALFRPTGARGRAPLMVGIHGNGGTAENMFKGNELGFLAKERGWYALFPESDVNATTDPRPDWTDLRYLAAVIDRVVAEHPVDPARVWVVGFSAGGQSAYRLATFRSDRIAAIATCGAPIGFQGTSLDHAWDPAVARARPVSILHLHGGEDGRVPLAGGPIDEYTDVVRLPVEEALLRFARHYDAREVAKPKPPAACPKATRSRRWETARGVAIHAAIDPDLAHSWPPYANAAVRGFLESVPPRR